VAFHSTRQSVRERASEILSAHGSLGLGSARISRVWFRRRAETNFICSFPFVGHAMSKEKVAIAGRNRQARDRQARETPCATLRLFDARFSTFTLQFA
jgi:hypothetical protein